MTKKIQKKTVPFFVYYLQVAKPTFGPELWIKAAAQRMIFSNYGEWVREQYSHMEKMLEYTCSNEPKVEDALIDQRIVDAVDCN